MRTAIARLLLGLLVLATSQTLLVPSAHATPHSYPNMSRYPTYNDHFYSGPRVHNLGYYIPQGLAAWPGRDELIVSSYDKRGDRYDSLLSVETLGGSQTKVVRIGGGHVGGLATGGGYLWVANTTSTGAHKLRRYALSKIDAARSSSYVSADAIFDVRASSFVAWRDNDVWVGNFTSEFGTLGTLWRYDVSGGRVGASPIGSISTPGRTQGVAFSGNYVIWSQSYGRTSDSRIRTSTVSGSRTTYITAPPMTEDLAIVKDRLYVLYESGAQYYRKNEDHQGYPSSPITELHFASVTTLVRRL